MSAEDFAKFLEKFLGEVPPGPEGDAEMRRRIKVPFMDTTDEDVRRDDLTDDEIDGWQQYHAWNLWEVIANRATEGPSGLIPRQEYETISFVQAWAKFPRLFRELTEAIGVEGVIKLGATPRHEVSTQVNATRHYGTPMCTMVGRGIAVNLGLEKATDRREDVVSTIQFGRRLFHGLWGGGPTFVSGRNYSQASLDPEIVNGFLAAEQKLDDPELRQNFQKFNAATELFGFLMHYDCRAGLCDTGPYPVPGTDNGFMIVRDHQLNEPAFPWGHFGEGLPWSVTSAMVFRPDEPIDVKVNDISTTFTRPGDYQKHLSGVAVYARDTWDTPMSELRPLGPDELADITAKAKAATLALYKDIARKDRDQKIRDGILVYSTILTMPYARTVPGLWEGWVKDGFYDLDELTLAAYPTLAGGDAMAALAPVFILGQGFPSVAGEPAPV
jgi:hypothetical protein